MGGPLIFFYAFISEFSSKISMAEALPIFKSLRIIIKSNYAEGINLLTGAPLILILNEAKNIKSLSTDPKIAGKKSILVVDDEAGPS
jgi:hypothetical protein